MKNAKKNIKIITTKGIERKATREINKIFKKLFARYNIEQFEKN